VVVSQGTVDNTDPDKLIAPTIEALKDEPYVVVATTGGVATDDLRGPYAAHPNVVVEDFVDYGTLLPRADVFVTSGGWGSTLAAIGAGVPLVGAGTREGKNDLNMRVEHNRASTWARSTPGRRQSARPWPGSSVTQASGPTWRARGPSSRHTTRWGPQSGPSPRSACRGRA